jgi:hypothetical protein
MDLLVTKIKITKITKRTKMRKTYVLQSAYLQAKGIVNAYEKQISESILKPGDLTINQKVKRNYPESWDYWVTEFQGEDILIRSTEDENDPNYNDYLVNIAELRVA